MWSSLSPQALGAQVHETRQAPGSFWTATAGDVVAQPGWRFNGVGLAQGRSIMLAPSMHTPLSCGPHDIDGGHAIYDSDVGLCRGHDPYQAGHYAGRNYYNGGTFYYGTLLSPIYQAARFEQAIVSWAGRTPPGTWLQAHLQVHLTTGAWTRWYNMPVWAAGTDTIQRHSIDGQSGVATVSTDTLVLHRGFSASGFQIAVTLFSTTPAAASPALSRLSIALSRATIPLPSAIDAYTSPLRGHDLNVPARSQMLAAYRDLGYGGGGEAWCSPTSVSMILAYWAQALHRHDLSVTVPEAAAGVYDWTYDGAGNWPFNVAYAASFPAMDGYVVRLPSLAAAEPWIASGIPLALSIAFSPGTLPGAPIPSTAGHLVVLRGFDRSGNPLVNDPAAPNAASVRRVYPRAAFERAWLGGSGGMAYAIFPAGYHVPAAAP